MQSDFEPKQLKEAKEILSNHLDDVKVYVKKEQKEETNESLSLWNKLWKKFLTLFR